MNPPTYNCVNHPACTNLVYVSGARCLSCASANASNAPITNLPQGPPPTPERNFEAEEIANQINPTGKLPPPEEKK